MINKLTLSEILKAATKIEIWQRKERYDSRSSKNMVDEMSLDWKMKGVDYEGWSFDIIKIKVSYAHHIYYELFGQSFQDIYAISAKSNDIDVGLYQNDEEIKRLYDIIDKIYLEKQKKEEERMIEDKEKEVKEAVNNAKRIIN